MFRIVLIAIFTCLAGRCLCQTTFPLPADGKGKQLFGSISITDDHDYMINRLVSDTNLVFRPIADSVKTGRQYWLKIVVDNPNHASQDFVAAISPQLNNTLYYFDPDQQHWLTSQTDAVNNTGSRLRGRHRLSFPGKYTTVLYVKVDCKDMTLVDQVKLDVSFQSGDLAAAHEQAICTAWICCMIVMLLFVLSNLYIYWSFKDKAVLYYMLAQLGGMVYITTYRWILNLFLPSYLFNVDFHEIITYYDLNKVINHLSIAVVLYAIAAFTRIFLHTKVNLPMLDSLLRKSVRAYWIFTVVAIAVNVAGYNLEHYTVNFDNLVCILLIALIMAAGIFSYAKKIPFAATFILANGLPFVFILAIPISHLVVAMPNTENLWIPELAIISQALGFSVALVARTRTIQSALSTAQLSNQQLAFDLKETSYQVQVNHLEIAKANADVSAEKAKNDLLQQTLQTNQRELAASTLHMIQKNELLSHLKSQLQVLSRPNPSTAQGMRAMSSLIDSSTQLDSDWARFKIHFEQVHPHFFEELKSRHPHLTTRETRLYAYFHMKLSHKEIAALLNIDPASVRRAKTRLFKKMALPEND